MAEASAWLSSDLLPAERDELWESAQVVAEEIAELPSPSAKESAECTRSMTKDMVEAARAVADASRLA